MSTSAGHPAPIPVTTLVGFLGAGKTTLLQRLLADPQGQRIAVLVNDFGAINIDAELIVEAGPDRIALSNGCICCSIRDDLVTALRQVLELSPRPDRLVIEASGVSRPLAIIGAVEQPEHDGRLAVDATICLVDADQFPDLDYTASELAIDQAASSDILVLNKCDVASPESIAATERALTEPLPGVRRIRTSFARVPHEVLLGPDLRRSDGAAARAGARGQDLDRDHDQDRTLDDEHVCGPRCTHDHHDHSHEHDEVFEAWSWSSEGALDLDRVRAALRSLPAGLLRAKGILRFRDGKVARAAELQVVGRRNSLTPVERAAPAESRVVAIALKGGLDRAALDALFEGCRAG